MLDKINEQIDRMTAYGVREQKVTRNSYILSWSNGKASWSVSGIQPKVGTTVRLDANELLVEVKRRKDIEPLLPQLHVLPLYYNSFEYIYGSR